jgi:hypothetical protein
MTRRYARAGRSARLRYATARSFIPSTICSCPWHIARPISTRRCRQLRTASRPSATWKRDPIDKSPGSAGADLNLQGSIKMPRNAGFTASDGGAVLEKTARSPNDADIIVGHHVDRHSAFLARLALRWIKQANSRCTGPENERTGTAGRAALRPNPSRLVHHATRFHLSLLRANEWLSECANS